MQRLVSVEGGATPEYRVSTVGPPLGLRWGSTFIWQRSGEQRDH